jgi:hypothetical protein
MFSIIIVILGLLLLIVIMTFGKYFIIKSIIVVPKYKKMDDWQRKLYEWLLEKYKNIDDMTTNHRKFYDEMNYKYRDDTLSIKMKYFLKSLKDTKS